MSEKRTILEVLSDACIADAQHMEECIATRWAKCDSYGDAEHECNGCPAWESFKTRYAARAKETP